jgi:hypothetical protein
VRPHRLYEQKKSSNHLDDILGEYVHRWLYWTTARLKMIKAPLDGEAEIMSAIKQCCRFSACKQKYTQA